MIGEVRPGRRGRWIAAVATVLALGSLMVGISIGNSGSPGGSRLAAGAGPSGTVPSGTKQSGSQPTDTSSVGASSGGQPGGAALPVGLKLSAGQAQQPVTPVPVAAGKPLGADRIAAIIHRLPPFKSDDRLAESFRWPAQTTPAPTAGKKVAIAFPNSGKDNSAAPGKPAATPTGPLAVLRMQPQGAVTIAPFISITFNQPMVPVATVGQLASTKVPVTISPQLRGSWQWIGTSTARFAVDSADLDRLPMATKYTVTVPADTKSATGATIDKAANFAFSTPPPSVKHFAPTGQSMKLDPIFLAVFDQKVDPKAVLDRVTVKAGDGTQPVRLATGAELAADAGAAKTASAAPAGRVVAFRPTRDLPADQPITVVFGAGTPSVEGPGRSAAAATFTGHTYSAFELGLYNCGGGNCQPSSPLVLTFNNMLDRKSFDPSTIKISPEIPGGAQISASGDYIYIAGATQADTTYTVAVPAGLTDTFGQKLGEPKAVTVRIGAAVTRMDPFPNPLTTLDPMVDKPTLSVNTVNRKEFRERVFAVSASDWPDYQRLYLKFLNGRQSSFGVPGWPVLIDRTVQINPQPNRLVSTPLDLSAVLSRSGSTGHVVVLIEPTAAESFSGDSYYQNQPTITWAQKTTIGLDALNDATGLRAWATDLRDGSPLPGVTVAMLGSDGVPNADRTVATDADGIAAMDLTKGGAGALLATKGNQTALLPSEMWNHSWATTARHDRLLWYVNDDRQTYRPGESVSVKGWVRRQSVGVAAALAVPSNSTAAYTVRDAYGVVIGHGTAKVSKLGGFDMTFAIPAGANLGDAQIELRLAGTSAGDSFSHAFQIADFRTPDFEVDAHGESAAPYVVGDDLTVAADASYYAGGPLGDAQVDWQVRTAPASYAPAGWDAFTFGIWTPWWQPDNPGFGGDSYSGGSYPSGPYSPCCQPADPSTSKVDKFSGGTDGEGANYLNVKVGNLGADNAGLPVTVTAQATVTDVNRQAIAGTANLLVHPADYYVGLSSPDTFVTQGKDLAVQAIATDIDGAATAGLKIDVRASKVTTSWTNGTSVDTESDTQRCQVTSTTRPVSCTFKPPAAGTYRITATVTDKKGRTSRSQLTRWVAGPDGAIDASVQRQQLTLVPDKREYQPGDSARLLVQSPIRAGSGLMTVLHNGIASTSRFTVAGGAAVVELPVTEADIPGVTASIEVVGTVPRSTADSGGTALPRPAYATGGIDLTVSTQSRTLKVTATPRQKTVAPGASTQLDVTVKDQHGKPLAGSEFEVVVADEAVLALGGQQLPDPLQAFYPRPENQLTALYGRSTIALTDPLPPTPAQGAAGGSSASGSAAASSGAPAAPAAAPSAGAASSTADRAPAGASKSASSAPIADRTNFDALALFVPSAVTDANGRASIKVPLPDSLTRYRVMVVAVAGAAQFGTAESTITAALPVTVRPSGPQFLNFGDTLQLPVLVQNQTDAALTTDVVMQAANLKLTGPAGKQVTVPAHGRVEVDFAVSADQAGTAKFRVAAVGGDSADAATIELPVYTPTTTESFATYGTVGGGDTISQPLSAPKGVVEAFGGLQVSTSSTALQQLTDAVGYLADYDYDSSDALAAQIIAIGSLGDVLQAFSAPGLPSAAALKAMVAADVDKLRALQNDDGGFPYWRRGDKSDAFNSIQATQALLVAQAYGSAVSKDSVDRAMQYLAAINSHIPKTASPATRDNLRAYALRVRMQGGHRDSVGAEALVASRGKALPLDAVAWLLPVVTDPGTQSTLLQILNNAAVDDAGSVTFTNTVTDDAWTTLQSDRRTDGLILDALISVKPDSDLIGKIVSGLMAAQQGGRWDNVQENAFILLALRHYYDAFEKTTPDFVAGVWLGDQFAGQHDFSGHTTERATVSIPTTELVKAGNTDVTVRNAGTGTLFYRLALQSAPSDLKLAPLDRGFVVSRTYTAVDGPGDVSRDANGTWHLKAGARVRVQLELVSRSAHTHVALIDPLPAGLQILNPELATTPKDLGPIAVPAAGALDWYSTWYDHQNLRDDRAEAFASQLQGGVYDYTYVARATTAGTFVAPPTRAEMVYTPETFGRAGTDKVVIGG